MNEYLLDLLNRMDDTSDQKMEPGYDSSKTISWKALREAEKLDNPDLVPQLIEYIEKEKKKEYRSHAYFALGHLTKNTDNKNGVQFLINRIDKEKDQYIIGALLDRISDLNKPKRTNIDPIIASTKNEKWLIDYNNYRPHDGLGGLSPMRYLKKNSKQSKSQKQRKYAF